MLLNDVWDSWGETQICGTASFDLKIRGYFRPQQTRDTQHVSGRVPSAWMSHCGEQSVSVSSWTSGTYLYWRSDCPEDLSQVWCEWDFLFAVTEFIMFVFFFFYSHSFCCDVFFCCVTSNISLLWNMTNRMLRWYFFFALISILFDFEINGLSSDAATF